MTRHRVCIGRDVSAVSEHADGIELEGQTRLRPGDEILIVRPSSGDAPLVRTAMVWSWYVRRLGSDGPTYRGICRWT